jgi:hypothetical protein
MSVSATVPSVIGSTSAASAAVAADVKCPTLTSPLTSKVPLSNNNNNSDNKIDDDASTVAHVPGYSSIRSLFENRRSIVLRGIRDRYCSFIDPYSVIDSKIKCFECSECFEWWYNSDGRNVIIKLLNADYPSSVQLWLFEQQYELTRSLSHLEGVVQVII